MADDDEFDVEINPFSRPKDEEIFTFKDKERLRKLAERDRNRKLKIWEKNKPTREGCLRRLCETDIEPAALAINPKVADQINLADAAGFNVPVERSKNRENRWKLIEKKREMFLVEMMLRIKNSKIEELMTTNEMKQIGLICSEQMLQEDTRSFLEFFADIKDQTAKASAELEKLKKDRNDKALRLRQIQDECSAIQSKINKDLETLGIQFDYKLFLDNLKPPEERSAQVAKKLSSNNLKKKPDTSKKGKKSKDNDPKKEAFVITYPSKLKSLFEDDDEDEEYEVPFKNPEELMNIFADLEEQNLKLIQQGQETEQAIELRKKKMEEETIREDGELDKLEKREKEVSDRFKKIVEEKINLESTSAGDVTKMMSNEELIKKKIREIKEKCGKSGINDQSPLTMLSDIEHSINKFIRYFDIAKKVDKMRVERGATKQYANG